MRIFKGYHEPVATGPNRSGCVRFKSVFFFESGELQPVRSGPNRFGPVRFRSFSSSLNRTFERYDLQDEDADQGEESETEDEDREGENRYWNLKQAEDEVMRKVRTFIISCMRHA